MYMKITEPFEGVNQNRWLDQSHSNADHHNMRCISSSQIKFLAEGNSFESYYKTYITKEVDKEFNDSFRVGTIAHIAVLEPQKFEETVKVCDLDQRTKEFKEWRAEIAGVKKLEQIPEVLKTLFKELSDAEDELPQASTKEQEKVIKAKIKKYKADIKTLEASKPKQEFEIKFTKDGAFLDISGNEIFVIDSKEMKMMRSFQKAFEEHKRLNVMVPDCIIEQTGIAQDPVTGLWMSLRGDARCPRGYFLDPKTTDKRLNEDSISRTISDNNYHIQAAHYLETANLIEPNTYKKFYFIMMSKKQPYEIALVTLPDEDLELGKKIRRLLLNHIAKCESSQRWPAIDFNHGVHGMKVKLPPWAHTKLLMLEGLHGQIQSG